MHYTTIEIDCQQFINNIQILKTYIGKLKQNIKFCLPIKANAYGHGLVGIAKVSEEHVDYFAVANLNEGEVLRQNGIVKPILVFGAFADEQVAGLIKHQLEITVSSLYKAELITKYCKSGRLKARIHIKIDTGMNRVGVRVSSAKSLIDFVVRQKELELVGVYSHLANSDVINDEFTFRQIEQFKHVSDYVKSIDGNVICHLANSGGVCFYPESYFDMVRPGIAAYGYLLDMIKPECELARIKPCFSLKSMVTYFKVVAKNSGISYNHTYITSEQTRVVTIPIGYGDGYRRALSNLGQVIMHGNKYTISGIICMDMLMVDIGYEGTAYVGDIVVLIGNQGTENITLESVAKLCGTITYEILCGFNERIPRIYVNNSKT